MLNTTSRVQSLCGTYNAGLLISENIYKEVKNIDSFQMKYEDEVILKGKQNPVKIYSVKRTN